MANVYTLLNIVARFRSNANDGRLLFYDFIDMCWDKQIKSEIEENDKEMNGGGLERIERLGSHRESCRLSRHHLAGKWSIGLSICIDCTCVMLCHGSRISTRL